MKKDINRQLEDYSKINFQNDLNNLENDVNRRINISQARQNEPKNHMERWFGMPAYMSASAIAATLIVGIFLGTQIQTEIILDNHDDLGFEVFSATNAKLPSSLLAPKT